MAKFWGRGLSFGCPRRENNIACLGVEHCYIIAMKTIILTTKAAKEFDALPLAARVAVDNALILYATQGSGDVKKLQGAAGYRMRVGDYRILFAEDAVTVLAVYIGRRSTTTYRRL